MTHPTAEPPPPTPRCDICAWPAGHTSADPHCDSCGQRLLLLRPGRTTCEACRLATTTERHVAGGGTARTV
jgi:uncharacterized Zn finger protein (UPF0148 family)